MGDRLATIDMGQNVVRAEAYLHTKCHFDPSNRLTTIQQRHRQDRQTDSWTDNDPVA